MSASQVRHYSSLIQRQTTLDGAAQALADAAQTLGWEFAAFHADLKSKALPRASDGDYIAHAMGWPIDYLKHWIDLDMGHHCPVGQRCLGATEMFFWTCDTSDAVWNGMRMTPQHRQVLDHYGALLSGGIAVPVPRANGKTGYVSWCSRKSDHLHSRYERSFSSAFLLSHVFIHHAARLTPARDDPAAPDLLSAREKECLTWAARGKTEQEIGAILYRSAATVHFHLRNAMIKLHAGNRTHAVAIACTRGLIAAD